MNQTIALHTPSNTKIFITNSCLLPKLLVSMYRRLYCSPFILILLFCIACTEKNEIPEESDIVMRTDLGDVYIKLYDETPLHKENFLKLTREGFFDGQAFHRIVNHLVVQAGDPRTVTAYPPTDRHAPYDAGYKLPAEIIDTMAHTYGKIGAARKDTFLNPERQSSSSQFYIVTGRKMSVAGLDSVEADRSGLLQSDMFRIYKPLKDRGMTQKTFVEFLDSVNFQAFKYPKHQEQVYYRKGGVPSLDNEYTIFGVVLKGMDIVEQIEILPTNKYEMPEEAFRINKMELIQKDDQ